jgi:hypothetical protein
MRVLSWIAGWLRRLLWTFAVVALLAGLLASAQRWFGYNDAPHPLTCGGVQVPDWLLDGRWVELTGCTIQLAEPEEGADPAAPLEAVVLDPQGEVVGVAQVPAGRREALAAAVEAGTAPALRGLARRTPAFMTCTPAAAAGCFRLELDAAPDRTGPVVAYVFGALVSLWLGWRAFRRRAARDRVGLDVQPLAAAVDAIHGPRVVAAGAALAVLVGTFALGLAFGAFLEPLGGGRWMIAVVPPLVFGVVLALGMAAARAWAWRPSLWTGLSAALAFLASACSLAVVRRDPLLSLVGGATWALLGVLLLRWGPVLSRPRRLDEPRLGLAGCDLVHPPPPVYPPLPGRRSVGGYALLGLGWLFRVLGILVLTGGQAVAQILPPFLIVTWPIHQLAFLAAGRLHDLRRRYASPEARQVLQSDPRAPCLLLRSFADDGMRRPLSAAQAVLRGLVTLEDSLAELLWAYGPVIAIGKPGERTPPVGAAREYVPHETWRERVRELATRSRLLFVILGPTPGIAWELRTILEAGWLERTVLWMPPVPPAEARRRGGIVAQAFDGTPVGAALGALDWSAVRAVVFRDGVPLPLFGSWSHGTAPLTAADVAIRAVVGAGGGGGVPGRVA